MRNSILGYGLFAALVVASGAVGCGSSIAQVDSSRLAVIPFEKKLEMYRAEHEYDVARAQRDDLTRKAEQADQQYERAEEAASTARNRLDAEEGILDAMRATNDRARINDQQGRTKRARATRDTAELREQLREVERDLAQAEAERAELEEQAGNARVQHLRVQLLRRYAPRRVPEDSSDIEETHAELQSDLQEHRAEAQSLRQRVAELRRREQQLAQSSEGGGGGGGAGGGAGGAQRASSD